MKRRIKLLVMMFPLALAGNIHAGIVNTKHNLSASGPGHYRAQDEQEICIFCHIPHNSSPSGPLWNRVDPGAYYEPYWSSTSEATIGQPTGSSILCLSCHDGTIALGAVLSEPLPISMLGGDVFIPSDSAYIGQNLSDDHPISFAYTQALASMQGELAPPTSLTGAVRLDSSGQLQCTSCHDPHNNDYGNFLVADNRYSKICTECHTIQDWQVSSHSTSNAAWNGIGQDPWPHGEWTSVMENGCENCHRPHGAGSGQRIMNYLVEEENCYPCHNGNVAAGNIQAEFEKWSHHPVESTTEVHDENEPTISESRHVECVDCHNPHLAGVPNALFAGVRGVDVNGVELASASYEYEVCYRCHADGYDNPPPKISRQIPQNNLRLEFNPGNPSFHPVNGPRLNPNVPSLLVPLNQDSVIACTDCHNNNDGPNAGGAGPNGPHGSSYPFLLELNYLTADLTPESPSAYALCYKCHNRDSILSNQSFPRHSIYVQDQMTPCSVCHDPHGISSLQGTETNNGNLINFDINIVSENSSGLLIYESTGVRSGFCSLNCHGHDHNSSSYGN